jgi:hypothetical protein
MVQITLQLSSVATYRILNLISLIPIQKILNIQDQMNSVNDN